ncbi:hypothetical protein JB92DRAFT_3082287 [Gautieria morchelliformis]|nr:hypothetical protein JB92DRAFT_3082287 [Gautieria morchelliformis]
MAAISVQLSGVEHPFWKDLPHTDICQVICNDAFNDHTAKWCRNIGGDYQIDKRFCRLPKQHGFRHFSSGISKISQWSGREWKDLERNFLPVIYGVVKSDIIQAVRAELDFIFTAQWKHLSEGDLQRLSEFDQIYDIHQEAFRGEDNWAIPKKHKRYHIDMVKWAFEHTNQKEYLAQMILWLTRQDKIRQRSLYFHWIDNDWLSYNQM